MGRSWKNGLMAHRPEGRTPARVRLLRLPSLIASAFRFVLQSGRGEFALILVLEITIAVALGAQLLLARAVLDALSDTGTSGFSVGPLAPEFTCLGIATVMSGFALTALTERRAVLTELVSRHIHDCLIQVATGVDLAEFDSPQFYDRLERAKEDAARRTNELVYGVVTLGSGLLSMTALFGVLFTIGVPLLPLVLIAHIPLWFATSRNGRSAYEFAFWTTSADRQREYLQRVLTGKAEAKEVRLFALSAELRRRYADIYDMRIRALRRVVRRRLRRSLIGNVVSTGVAVGAAILLIQMAADGRITTADAGVAVVALLQIGSRLRAINSGAAALTESSLFLADFIEFLDLRPRAQAVEVVWPLPNFQGVVADCVTFVYPETDRLVLDDVSIRIEPGEMVALVGRNGSGKSTLAKILCGLHTPTAGRVTWSGVDMATLDPAMLRSSVTAIFQDFVCYELPAQDNVGVGNTDRLDDLEGIRRAARDAGIDDHLDSLPAGYDTVLSRAFENGAELSIGQWQRVALARAFFRDAPFIVLDEPAAALDAEAEHELFAYVRDLQRDRSALVISHRLSTVREADRIYVLDEGRVIESGTHDELMSLGRHYFDLFTLQASAYLAEPRRRER
jgi:ATP-binding cassette subfamily B protein